MIGDDDDDIMDRRRPIILDSGCGTGKSTLLLGERYPDHWVIGVDRSFTRLSKQPLSLSSGASTSTTPSSPYTAASKRPYCEQVSGNTILVRAELVDFWTCYLHQKWKISHHFLLYPNPYPTQTRVTQRWYAHPSFPLLLQLGSESITVRSNRQGYLKEFAQAVEIAHQL
jgi:tRNA (guanine-N7-)-methyltransferase